VFCGPGWKNTDGSFPEADGSTDGRALPPEGLKAEAEGELHTRCSMAPGAGRKTWGGIVFQAALLSAAAAAFGLAVNGGHIADYFRGEYRLAFAEGAAAEDPVLINFPEAADLFESGQAVFIDARTPEEFDDGRIAGAMNVPLFDPGSDMIWESLGLPREALIVAYCSGDLCQDSLILGRRLIRRGWPNIRVYVGGWEEWSAAGLPVERGR